MANKRTTRTTRTKAAKKRGATLRTSARSKSKSSDALMLLQDDHKRVKALFRKFDKMKENDPQRAELVQQACRELRIHTALEERMFYPLVHDEIKDANLIDEAEVEHNSAKQLIEQLQRLDARDPKFGATFKVLAEYVMHHVKEEENELFPQVRRARMDLADMASRMQSLKQELMADMGEQMPSGERMPRSGSRYEEVARH